MNTPFDLYQQMQKQAVDALVPGQVGAGPNPGTTGQMDSDPNGASNTNLALQRFAQAQAPILANTDADGGAGYSHPAPGLMPGMQMFADVKAASVIQEAQAFAEYVYALNKEAGLRDAVAKGVGKLNARLNPPAPGVMDQARAAVGQVATNVQGAAQTVAQQAQAHMSHAQQVAGAHASQLKQQAGQAMDTASQYVQQGFRNAQGLAQQAAAQHGQTAAAVGAGALMGGAAVGGGVALANHKQASMSVEDAAELGRQFALQQLASQGY